MSDDTKPVTQADLRALEARLRAEIAAAAREITRHLDVVAENLVYDFKGIFKDRLEQHEDRLTRLERATGIRR